MKDAEMDVTWADSLAGTKAVGSAVRSVVDWAAQMVAHLVDAMDELWAAVKAAS